MKYPAILTTMKSGEEEIIDPSGQPVAKLQNFWQWAHSDLVGNAERGLLAEYIVACALGLTDEGRVEWDKYDLKTKDGISVEIKTSGYIQTWGQKKLSTLQFGIRETFELNIETNEYAKVAKRQADVYVFCVHKHKDQETINPLDLRQWEFYVLSTKDLNEKVGNQKSIGLGRLMEIGAVKSSFEHLLETIRKSKAVI